MTSIARWTNHCRVFERALKLLELCVHNSKVSAHNAIEGIESWLELDLHRLLGGHGMAQCFRPLIKPAG